MSRFYLFFIYSNNQGISLNTIFIVFEGINFVKTFEILAENSFLFRGRKNAECLNILSGLIQR